MQAQWITNISRIGNNSIFYGILVFMQFSSLQAQEIALTIIHANSERWLSLVLCVCVCMEVYVCGCVCVHIFPLHIQSWETSA